MGTMCHLMFWLPVLKYIYVKRRNILAVVDPKEDKKHDYSLEEFHKSEDSGNGSNSQLKS